MISSEQATMWTIQTKNAWEKAKCIGVLKADDCYIDEDFLKPYQWSPGQMSDRIPGYEGGYPVWAWPNKLDLRRAGHLPPGDDGVRIEFSADPQDVLLSDFDAWHDVLNGTLLNPGECISKNGYFSVWTMAEANPARAEEIINSWEKIFDIDLLKQYDPDQTLQATMGSIALSQVVSVTPFKAR